MMTRKTRALSLSVSLALGGCVAETSTERDERPVQMPAQDSEHEKSPVSVDQLTPQASPGGDFLGGLVRGAGSGAGKGGGADPGCPTWGCGANHNRRLVRI